MRRQPRALSSAQLFDEQGCEHGGFAGIGWGDRRPDLDIAAESGCQATARPVAFLSKVSFFCKLLSYTFTALLKESYDPAASPSVQSRIYLGRRDLEPNSFSPLGGVTRVTLFKFLAFLFCSAK